MTIADLIAEHRALSRRTSLSDAEKKRLKSLRDLLGSAVKEDIISPDAWAEIQDEIPTTPDLGGDDDA